MVELPKVAFDKVIPSSLRCFQDGRTPFLGTVLNPVPKLLGNIAQAVARDSLAGNLAFKLPLRQAYKMLVSAGKL